MRRFLTLTLSAVLFTLLLSGCFVHEWPNPPSKVALHLSLEYDTDMDTTETIYGTRSQTSLTQSDIRYIIRAYPITKGGKAAQDFTDEFIFTGEPAEGYDRGFTLELPEGAYSIMVWCDLVDDGSSDDRHYNTEDFSSITLNGESHPGNTDERDAFRGTGEVTLVSDITERLPDTLHIAMERPLAKYEFIADDLAEFIEKQSLMAMEQSGTKSIDLEKYRVVIYYVGFMPDTYSLFTDKPVDSSTGVFFETDLTQISDTEASLGFDYVFVNGQSSAVTVQIAIYGPGGGQVALTDPIEVPISRSTHTVMRGGYLLSEASGGISLNPDFDGDHNLIL